MVDPAVIAIVHKYLKGLPAVGIHPVRAVIFGSQTTGNLHEWSDIDLIVIAPEFDSRPIPLELVEKLWQARAGIDWRLEPIPCGVSEWESAHSRPILSIAEMNGFEVAA